MIVGLGMDVTELDRIERSFARFGERFLGKLLTDREREILPERHPLPFLAAQFAGKEAGAKALGTGFRQGISLRTIEICRLESGRPTVVFLGPAREAADRLGATNALVSLTHGRDVAAAVVVLEKCSAVPRVSP